MSAFLVKDKTISKIANTLVKFSLDDTLNTPNFKRLSEIIGRNKKELAKEIYELNCLALKERYPESFEDRIENFEYKEKEFNRIDENIAQFYNSLSCIIYQCSEGKATQEKLYNQLEEAENILARFIADKWANRQGSQWE